LSLLYIFLSKLSKVHQNEIFFGFETGTYNLIIATKWAEDLEIPPASVVIRWVMSLTLSVYDTYGSLPDMIFLTVTSPTPIAVLGHADRMRILSI